MGGGRARQIRGLRQRSSGRAAWRALKRRPARRARRASSIPRKPDRRGSGSPAGRWERLRQRAHVTATGIHKCIQRVQRFRRGLFIDLSHRPNLLHSQTARTLTFRPRFPRQANFRVGHNRAEQGLGQRVGYLAANTPVRPQIWRASSYFWGHPWAEARLRAAKPDWLQAATLAGLDGRGHGKVRSHAARRQGPRAKKAAAIRPLAAWRRIVMTLVVSKTSLSPPARARVFRSRESAPETEPGHQTSVSGRASTGTVCRRGRSAASASGRFRCAMLAETPCLRHTGWTRASRIPLSRAEVAPRRAPTGPSARWPFGLTLSQAAL